MLRIHVRPEWSLQRPGREAFALPQVIRLCAAVQDSGSLSAAARQLGLSYRHAWGLIREAEQAFGAPLMLMERGRGGTLTRLGEVLLWADRRIAARLSPALDSLSSELSAEMERVLSHAAPVRIQASHGFAVQALRECLAESAQPFDLRYTSSAEALSALARQECDLAGFHIPQGSLQTAALSPYLDALGSRPLRLVNLATRSQGLMVPPGNPLAIRGISDLARGSARFVNRQPGSGTRLLIDLLLAQHGVDRARMPGYEVWEYTHAAVAAYIASGMADVGIGIETAARRFNLEFLPLLTERYFLACLPEPECPPALASVLDLLAAEDLRRRIAELPGYDPVACGTQLSLAEAFPESFGTVERNGGETALN
ncbi:MAG: helix-turn-helix transcriptional regulator [Pseudomonadota bacterium]|nr:helix-turn-helix transcriptional regulator [Pseudomonadota bacterium]